MRQQIIKKRRYEKKMKLKQKVAYAMAVLLGMTSAFGGTSLPAPKAPCVSEALAASVTPVTVSNLKWKGETGYLSYTTDAASKQYWGERIYHNGELIQWRGGFYEQPAGEHEKSALLDIDEVGDYTFRIVTANDLESVKNEDIRESELSGIFRYDPKSRLSTPSKPIQSSGKQNVLSWEDVGHKVSSGYRYRIRLFEDGNRMGWAYFTNENSFDLTDYIRDLDTHSYQIKVCALSDDLSATGHSLYSQLSDPIGYTQQAVEMKSAIENAAESGNKTLITSVYKTESQKKELAKVIQSSSEAQKNIEKLENAYVKENNITVNPPKSSDERIDANAIKVIGAGLSANEGETIGLEVKPQSDSLSGYDTNGYNNVYAFEMNLVKGDGSKSTKVTELDVPITIIMPKPEGKVFGDLRILHFLADGSIDVIEPVMMPDGMVKFTISHFSTFAFAEAKSESSSSGSTKSNSPASKGSVSYVTGSSSSKGSGSSTNNAKKYSSGSSKGYYEKSGKGTATYYGPAVKKSAKSAKVPSTVKIEGKTYKVTKISSFAFTGYDKLTSVTIGSNVRKIEASAFSGCEKLKTLNVETKKLTAKGVNGSLKDSKVNTVRVSKKATKKLLNKYKKAFTAKNAGKKASVKKK